MKQLTIKGKTGISKLLVGEKIENCGKYINPEETVIITDTNVATLYQTHFPSTNVIAIGIGEKIKTFDTVTEIYASLVNMEADRSAFILGIGGGIVCDIAGFVASTYLRGVRFGFVATTLLSQVDASVGGKNGVNFGGYKNMVGVFNQPEFVICDPMVLKTLPDKEVLCGMAEIVKHAAIADTDLFAYLESRFTQARQLDIEVIERLVSDSVKIKAAIVGRDEKEQGERRKLNFGHTFGHAIEKISGVPHGEAVSAGMVQAARLSVQKGLLSAVDEQRIMTLLNNLNLPTAIPLQKHRVLDALKRDKKREGRHIHFVLLEGIGQAVVHKISIQKLEALFDK
jgi:3-dehydroquinate synthase